jgi:hypothetical protein
METQVPEDLTALTEDELNELEGQLTDEADRLLDDESDDLATLTQLSEQIAAVRGRKSEIAAERQAAAAQREELRKGIHGEADDDPEDAPAEEVDDPDETEPKEKVAAQADPVTAGARKPSASGTTRRAGRPQLPPEPPASRITIVAAADVPEVSQGAHLSVTDVARGFHRRARGLSDNGNRAPVATVHLDIPDSDWIDGEQRERDEEVIRRVTDPNGGRARRLNAADKSLVAAGGWCTPSEPLFDVFRLDDAQGLYDLPTVGVRRAGMQVPTPLLLDTTVTGALWTWTEASDNNTTVKTVTNKALTGNVATLTTSANHGFTVGQTVKVAIGDPVFDGTYVITAVTANTFSYARVNANVTSVAATGTAQLQKGCVRIPCPTWTDYRLEGEGLCVQHGNLMDAAYPELTREFVDLVMTAHAIRVSSQMLAKVQATATAVTLTTGPSSAASEILSGLELQAADYRSQYYMSDQRPLELVLPDWTKGVIRDDMAMRAGIGRMDVSDAEIDGWFGVRNLRPQFIKNYQQLYSGTNKVAWPGQLKALIYAAGAFVKGTGPVINLGVTRDSTLNPTNDFTAAWSEQFYLVARRGPVPREATINFVADGVTAIGP